MVQFVDVKSMSSGRTMTNKSKMFFIYYCIIWNRIIGRTDCRQRNIITQKKQEEKRREGEKKAMNKIINIETNQSKGLAGGVRKRNRTSLSSITAEDGVEDWRALRSLMNQQITWALVILKGSWSYSVQFLGLGFCIQLDWIGSDPTTY